MKVCETTQDPLVIIFCRLTNILPASCPELLERWQLKLISINDFWLWPAGYPGSTQPAVERGTNSLPSRHMPEGLKHTANCTQRHIFLMVTTSLVTSVLCLSFSSLLLLLPPPSSTCLCLFSTFYTYCSSAVAVARCQIKSEQIKSCITVMVVASWLRIVYFID